MPNGEAMFLARDPGTFIWRGTAQGVPVNFPPRDSPYLVRIYDPHLRDLPTGGITGERLQVGREALDHLDSYGTPQEAALVYIDENGLGHNPF